MQQESGDEGDDEKYYDGNVNNEIPEGFDNDEVTCVTYLTS